MLGLREEEQILPFLLAFIAVKTGTPLLRGPEWSDLGVSEEKGASEVEAVFPEQRVPGAH